MGVVNNEEGVVSEDRVRYGAMFDRVSRERDLIDGRRLLIERMRNLCVWWGVWGGVVGCGGVGEIEII